MSVYGRVWSVATAATKQDDIGPWRTDKRHSCVAIVFVFPACLWLGLCDGLHWFCRETAEMPALYLLRQCTSILYYPLVEEPFNVEQHELLSLFVGQTIRDRLGIICLLKWKLSRTRIGKICLISPHAKRSYQIKAMIKSCRISVCSVERKVWTTAKQRNKTHFFVASKSKATYEVH